MRVASPPPPSLPHPLQPPQGVGGVGLGLGFEFPGQDQLMLMMLWARGRHHIP